MNQRAEKRANFIQTIVGHLQADPKGSLLVEMHGGERRAVDNGTTFDRLARMRGTLRRHGVSPGDRIGLLAPNSARWATADLAILAEGAVVLPLYARQALDEVAFMLQDAGATVVVTDTRARADALREVWSAGPIVPFEELEGGEPIVDEPAPRKAEDLATIIYTSGTSAAPKGVMLTVANIDFMLPVTRDALGRLMGKREGHDVVFHYLPFCFAGSRIVLWTCLFRNNPITMSTDLDNLKEELAAASPHYFLNVPALLERIRNGVEAKIAGQSAAIRSLYRAGKAAYARQQEGAGRASDRWILALCRALIWKRIRAGIGPRLECLICGSAPLGPETQGWFEMLGIPVYQVYGLTETTAIVTMDEPRAATAGRVGHAIAGIDMKLGDEGELLTRGPHIFAGYWNRPDATEDAFLDGWFRTGDAAEIDDRGNLRIIGRTNNILVPESGHNVAPEPLEQTLLESIPGAEHVVVFGHGRPFLTAVVVGKVDRAEVKAKVDALNENLPHYRRIRAFHTTEDTLTPESGLLTANQKLKRRALEEHFAPSLAPLYAKEARP